MRIKLKAMIKRFAAGVVCVMLMVQSVCFAGNGVVDLSPNRESLEKRINERYEHHIYGDIKQVEFEDLLEDIINKKCKYSVSQGYGNNWDKYKKIIEEGDLETQMMFLLGVHVYLQYGVDYWRNRMGLSREDYIKQQTETSGYNYLLTSAMIQSLLTLSSWRNKDILFHIEDGTGEDITGYMSTYYWWYFGKLNQNIITEEGEKQFAEENLLNYIKYLSADGINDIVECVIELEGGKTIGKFQDGTIRGSRYTVANSPLSILYDTYNTGEFGDLKAFVLYSDEFQEVEESALIDWCLDTINIIKQEREFRGIE